MSRIKQLIDIDNPIEDDWPRGPGDPDAYGYPGQKHWIGKSNLWGRLKFWYYKKRGWTINDKFFAKGLKK